MKITIWHNPRCSKSRQALKLIEDRGIEPTIVRYLDVPPSETELERVLELLGKQPIDLMRRKEAVYKELCLDDDGLSNADLISVMVANPKIIERPVVIVGDRAALGRPPEAILEVLP